MLYGFVIIDVYEDVVIGFMIIKLFVNDKDLGFNGMVLYVIVSGNSGSLFKIDMYIGEFRIGLLLDREINVNYILNIIVFDCGFLVIKIFFIIVYIKVLDVNDNSLIFKNDLYEVILFEDIISG